MNEPMNGRIRELLRFDSEAETSTKRLLAIVGIGAALLLFTLWLFSGDGENAEQAVAAPPPAPVAAPAAIPDPVPVYAQPSASASQIVLYGVTGFGSDGAAIVAVDGGPQRLVRVGREVAPGLPLIAIAAQHILVRERGQEVRISFRDPQLSSNVNRASANIDQ